jgi:hypothetical protein
MLLSLYLSSLLMFPACLSILMASQIVPGQYLWMFALTSDLSDSLPWSVQLLLITGVPGVFIKTCGDIAVSLSDVYLSIGARALLFI